MRTAPRVLVPAVATLLAVGVATAGFVMVWLYGWLTEWDQADVRATTADAAPVIAALEEHRTEFGRYPDELSTVAPRLNGGTLPTPRTGTGAWYYAVWDGGTRYVLGFHCERRYPNARYDSGEGRWHQDT